MDIAVLSDIHGNHIALQKCIDYILGRGIKTFAFLGDYVGDLAYPQRTMVMLYSLRREYECYFIKGNKEDYWLNYRDNGETGWEYGNSTTGTLLYAYNNLTTEDLVFFESLTHRGTLAFEGLPAVTICHGSPDRANEKMSPGSDKTFAIMERDPNSLILCGHSHVQTRIEHAGKMVLNPGSVGVPIGSGGKSQFLILHGEAGCWKHEFVSLEYDVEKAVAELYEEKLDTQAPYWCKLTEHGLRTGEGSHGAILAKAMMLCQEETGVCNWPDIPDKYWEKAMEDL